MIIINPPWTAPTDGTKFVGIIRGGYNQLCLFNGKIFCTELSNTRPVHLLGWVTFEYYYTTNKYLVIDEIGANLRDYYNKGLSIDAIIAEMV